MGTYSSLYGGSSASSSGSAPSFRLSGLAQAEQGKTPIGFIGNAVSDAVGTLVSWGQLGLGVLEDAINVGRNVVTLGGYDSPDGYNTINLAKALTGYGPQESALLNYFRDNYFSGGEALANQLYERPISTFLDVSSLLTGGAGLVGKVGQVGKIAELGALRRLAGAGDLLAAEEAAAKAAQLSPLARAVSTLRDVRTARTALDAGADVVPTLGLSSAVSESARLTQLRRLVDAGQATVDQVSEYGRLVEQGVKDLDALLNASNIGPGARMVDAIVRKERLVASGTAGGNPKIYVRWEARNPLTRKIFQGPFERRFGMETVAQMEQRAAQLEIIAASQQLPAKLKEAALLRDTAAKMRQAGITLSDAPWLQNRAIKRGIDYLVGTRKSDFYSTRNNLFTQLSNIVKGLEDDLSSTDLQALTDYNIHGLDASVIPDILQQRGFGSTRDAAAAILAGTDNLPEVERNTIIEMLKRGEVPIEDLVVYEPEAVLAAIPERTALVEKVRTAMNAAGISEQAQNFVLMQIDRRARQVAEAAGSEAGLGVFYAEEAIRFGPEWVARQTQLLDNIEKVLRPASIGGEAASGLSPARALRARVHQAFGVSSSTVAGRQVRDADLYLRILDAAEGQVAASQKAWEAFREFKSGKWGTDVANGASEFARRVGLDPEKLRGIFDGTAPDAPSVVDDIVGIDNLFKNILDHFDWARARRRRGNVPDAPRPSVRPGLAAMRFGGDAKTAEVILRVTDRLNDMETMAGRMPTWTPEVVANAIWSDMRDTFRASLDRWRGQLVGSTDDVILGGRRMDPKAAIGYIDRFRQLIDDPDAFGSVAERISKNADFMALYEEMVRRGAQMVSNDVVLAQRMRQVLRGDALFGSSGGKLIDLIEQPGIAASSQAAARILDDLRSTDPAAYEAVVTAYGGAEATTDVVQALGRDLRAVADGATDGVSPEVVAAVSPYLDDARTVVNAVKAVDAPPPSVERRLGARPTILPDSPYAVSTTAPTEAVQTIADIGRAVGTARGSRRLVENRLKNVFGRGTRVEVLDEATLSARSNTALGAWDLITARIPVGTWTDSAVALSRIEEAGGRVLGVYDMTMTPAATGERALYAIVEFADAPDVRVRVEISTPRADEVRTATKAMHDYYDSVQSALADARRRFDESANQQTADGLVDPETYRAQEAVEALQVIAEKTERYLRSRWEIVLDEIDVQVHGAMPTGGPKRQAIESFRLFVDRELASPLVRNGYGVEHLFDREYLPLRIQSGARWDMARKTFVGGTDSLTLDAERAARGLHAPIYFPSVDARRLKMSDYLAVGSRTVGGRKMAEATYLERDTGFLFLEGYEVTDVMKAYQIRATRALKHLDIFEFYRKTLNEYGRRIDTVDDLAPGEAVVAPDGLIGFFNMKIGIEDRMAALMEKLAETSPFEDAAWLDDNDFAGVLADGLKDFLVSAPAEARALVLAVQEAMPEVRKNVLSVTRNVELWAVPKAVADRLDEHARYAKLLNGTKARLFFDLPSQAWRNTVLVGSPRWIINNILTNIISLKMQGGKVSDVIRQIFDPKFREILRELGGDELGGGLYQSMFNRKLGTAAQENKVAAALERVGETRPARGLKTYADWVRRTNGVVEEFFRNAGYIKAIDRKAIEAGARRVGNRFWTSKSRLDDLAANGMSPASAKAALDEVNYFFNDYNSLSPVEQHVVRRLIAPFYAWYKHIVRLTATFPFKYPGRARVMLESGRVAEQLAAENGDRPDWLKRAIPFGTDDKWLSSQGVTPWSQLTESPLGLLNPIWKIPIEQTMGRDLFTGRRFTDPNVIETYGGQLYRVEIGPDGRPVARPIDSNAPGLLEHILRQVPQYQMIRNIAGGGRVYDSSSLFDVLQGRGTVMNATGQTALPYDTWDKLISGLTGVTIFNYDLPAYQERIDGAQEQVLRAWYERMQLQQ